MYKHFKPKHHQEVRKEFKARFSSFKSVRDTILHFDAITEETLSSFLLDYCLCEIPSFALAKDSNNFRVGSKLFGLRIKHPNATKLEIIFGSMVKLYDTGKYIKSEISLLNDEVRESGISRLEKAEILVPKELEEYILDFGELVQNHFAASYQALKSQIEILFLINPHPLAIMDHVFKDLLTQAGLEHLYSEVFILTASKADGVRYIPTMEKVKLSLKSIANRGTDESYSPLELILYMFTHKTPYEEAFAKLTAERKSRTSYHVNEALYALSCPQMQIAELSIMGSDFEQVPFMVYKDQQLLLQFSSAHSEEMEAFMQYYQEELRELCTEYVKPNAKKWFERTLFRIKQKLYTIRESDVVSFIIEAYKKLEKGRDLLKG